MLVTATAQDRNGDIYTACGRLALKAGDRDQAELLAELARLFLRGGRLVIECEGREAFMWTQEKP